MTRPDSDKPASEKLEEDLDLSKETLEDLDPDQEARDVRGGAADYCDDVSRGSCSRPAC